MSDSAKVGASNRTANERGLANLRPRWKPGESGNPAGRKPALVDIAALARVHGPRCIEVAAELLEDADPRIRLAALVALLDRGFGKPPQAISGTTTDMPTMLQLMHHEAAREFSAKLAAEREAAERQLREPLVINGEVTAKQAGTPINLWAPALE
jgi:hypothetical protein